MFKLIKLFILAVIVAFIAGTAYFASKETKDAAGHAIANVVNEAIGNAEDTAVNKATEVYEDGKGKVVARVKDIRAEAKKRAMMKK